MTVGTLLTIVGVVMFLAGGDWMSCRCVFRRLPGDAGESRGGAEASEHHQRSAALLPGERGRRGWADGVGETSGHLPSTTSRRLSDD